MFVQDALNVHVRAHRLSRRAGPQPGQRGYVAAGIETMLRTARTLAGGQDLPTAVGKAFRQLATFGTASLQAALAPIIQTRQHRCVADAGARLVLSPGHCRHSPGPGRAAVAAGSGRGVCLVAGRG